MGCRKHYSTCRAGQKGRSIGLDAMCAAWLPECLLESKVDKGLREQADDLQGRAGRRGKLAWALGRLLAA